MTLNEVIKAIFGFEFKVDVNISGEIVNCKGDEKIETLMKYSKESIIDLRINYESSFIPQYERATL